MILVGYKYRFYGEDAKVSSYSRLSVVHYSCAVRTDCIQASRYRGIPRPELHLCIYTRPPTRHTHEEVSSICQSSSHATHYVQFRLLSQGYKVGIVEQTETAALKKVSDTRNDVFERKLTHVYTAATYVSYELWFRKGIERVC